MKTFKEDNRISLNDKVEADDDEAEPFLVGDETHKQMLYTQEATTRTHYARLVKYVRLIDYMLMDSKLSLINNSVSHALEIVREDFSNDRKVILRNKIQSCPLFEIECSFVRELYYTPSMYDLRDAIKNAVSEGIQLVGINEQFLHSLEFISKAYNNQDYEEKVAGEFNDLINLAISSETIRNNCQSIYDQVELTFSQITEFARSFQKYIDFYLENQQADGAEYQDHEAFRKAINEHLRQEDEIERFVPITDILIYRLNANSLRSEIRPSPGKCLVQIRDYMPKLSYNKLESLCSELDEANVLLSRIPKNINEFVEIMKYLWKMDSSIDDFTDRFQQIEQLHIVMDEYKVKFPEKNKSKFKDTHAALKSVRTKLEEGLQAGEANEVRFKKELDKEIPKLEQRIAAGNTELNNPELDNRNTKIQTAIDLVNILELEVNGIKDKGKLVNEQQRFLEINEVYFESVDTLVNSFTLKKKLWYGLKKMTAYSEEWKSIPLKFIDVEDIQGKLTEMVKSSTQCFNGLEGSDASLKFKDLGDLMKNTVPIVSALRDPALEDRHWDEINAILNTDADIHSDTFTLQAMIDLNLDQPAREQIAEIALKASKEAELEQLFNKVQSDWRFVKFDVNPYKDSKDYYVISSTEEVNEILEESLVSLNTILTSRYADHIRQDVEEFNSKKLSYLELLIDEWMEGQKGWTYLESIFHSPDISK